ncbi:RDD family protein [Bergeyella sp. RCAD1439]|uniref:RDD family protein n=1 Tax=Bergeyella anatis TaxID=3113737 RepID=UPI002E1975B2|nr:RDD family protein [Bergeyella sp. RCAD1439]
MNSIVINTSQNVGINFHIASIGERMLAFVIDMLIKGAYLLFMYLLLFQFLKLQNYFHLEDEWSVAAFLIILTLPIHLYTLVCESLMEGQTFGKKITKIKVVKIDGYQASFGDYLMRWIFRLVDIYSNGGVVGLLSAIISKHNQRLGDLATGTAVISLKHKAAISQTILENLTEDYQPSFPQVLALSDNDLRIIKDHYQKALKNDDNIIINKLTQKIVETLKLDAEKIPLTQRQFIATIIKDYSYYTGKDAAEGKPQSLQTK